MGGSSGDGRARPGRARRTRGHRSRGAALVEFALVMPVFVTLLFGIVDFGLVFSNLNAARQGVREAARAAAVDQLGTDTSCTMVASTSIPVETQKLICLAKARIGLNQSQTRVRVEFAAPAGDPDRNQVGKSVRVCAMYPMSSASGLFSQILGGKSMKSKVDMRMESPLPTNFEASEDALAGTSWDWCA